MAWTDDIQPLYGTVEGKFAGVSYDSADADLVPDVQPLEGTVTFTPTVAAGRIEDALVQILTTTRKIFGGQIVDDEQNPGVRLMSTDQPLGIEDWAWSATFQIDTGLRLKPLQFKLPAGQTVSITDGLVPDTSTPVQIVEGPPGPVGPSIYDVAVDAGFTGTPEEFIASITPTQAVVEAATTSVVAGLIGSRTVALDADGTPYLASTGATHYILADDESPYVAAQIIRGVTLDNGVPVLS